MPKSWCLALAATLIVLGFNPNQADAVALPYDTDENTLIDRKAGKINTGDPQWLVDGKFYDVGRNPDPRPGDAQTDWGDYRFRVTHIKLDWSIDVGAGLELQKDYSTQLDHIKDGRVKGEWMYKWADDPAKGRHEPALYACKEAVTIKVRVECADAISSAEIGARHAPDASGRTPWREVQKTKVHFFEKLPGALWVSKGPLINPAEPDLGFTEYVERPEPRRGRRALPRTCAGTT